MLLAIIAMSNLWLMTHHGAHADDYFVASNGNNASNGSAAAPWQTLQHAADVVHAGDRVTVLPGSYTGFYLDTSGTPTNPIEFIARPGVLINAPNVTTDDGINLEGASYVVIDGFEVANMPRTGVRTVGLPNNFARFVTIRNVYAHGNGKWGILTGHVDDLLIENNRMAGSVIEHGIYVSNSGDRPIVRNNIVWGNTRSGIQLNSDRDAGGDGIISDALVSGNIIYDNGAGGGSALNLDGVQNSRFENNLLYNNHASGISLYRIDGLQGAKNNTVVNNTIHMAADSRWALNIQNASTGNSVRNNILFDDADNHGAIDISADSLPGFTSDYNVVTPIFTTTGGSTLDLDEWRINTGNDVHSLAGDPASLFVSAAAGKYQLLPNTVANNAALSSDAPPLDLVGHPRPYNGGVDAGALERILTGDYNADGAVNSADYTIWRNTRGQTVYFGAAADGDLDGAVTPADFNVWKSHYGQSAGSGAGIRSSFEVPEPLTLLLTLAGLFMGGVSRWQRTVKIPDGRQFSDC